jgi:hypothetical protein
VLSLVASIVLTVLVNVALWIFPRVGERFEESLRRAAERAKPEPDDTNRSAVRVLFPWKLMLIASLVLTLALNLLVRLTR